MYKKLLGESSVRSVAIICAFTCSAPAMAFGEDVNLTDDDQKVDAAAQGRLSAAAIITGGGPVTKAGSGTTSESDDVAPILQFLTDGGKTRAVVDLSLAKNKSKVIARQDGAKGWTARFGATSDRFALKVDMPLGSSEELSSFDFKNLGIGTNVTIGYSKIWGQIDDNSTYYPLFESALEACGKDKKVEGVDKFFASYRLKRVEYPRQTPEQLILSISTSDQSLQKVASNLESKCYATGEKEMLKTYLSSAQLREVGVGLQGSIKMLGIDVTGGYDRYDFVDKVAFLKDDAKLTTFDISAYFAIINPKSEFSIKGTASFARGYKPNDEINFCAPAVGVQQCLKGPDGRPARDESAYVSVEARKLFSLSDKEGAQKFAIAPEFTWDVDESEWALDVPVYLHRDKKGILDGGVRFGYRSDKKDFAFGLFFGTTFDGLFF